MNTIEQKAKAYDEAFDKIRKLYAGANSTLIVTTKSLLEKIFPELRESEDEMIRRTLVEYFGPEVQLDFVRGVPIQKIRDWLEKQKEPEKEELAYRLNGLMQEYINEGEDEDEKEHRFKCYKLFWDALEDTSYFEKKEQKPSSGIYWHAIKKGEKLPCRAYIWDHNFEKYYDFWEGRLIPNMENISIGRDTWYLPADDVRDLPREGVDELLKGHNSAWSEEDEKKREQVIKILEQANENWRTAQGSVPFGTLISWLKSLRPQSKREWSEEDEKMLADTYFKLAGFMGNEKNLDWLKSLKNLFSHERGC